MPASQKQLIEVFKRQCQKVEEPYGGYRSDLLVAIADIANIERNHKIAPTNNVLQRVHDQCEALGALINRKGKSAE